MVKTFIEKLTNCLSDRQDKAKQQPNDYNEDTTKTILEAAKSEYQNENDRNKHVEDKAKSLITLSGVLITISLSIIKAINDNGWFGFLVFALLLIVIFLVIAIWMLLQMLKMQDFHKIKLDSIVLNSEMKKSNSEVMANLSVSYETSIIENRKIIDKKVKAFNKSIRIVEYSIILLIFISTIIALQNTDYVQNKFKPDKEYMRFSSTSVNGCFVCHIQIHAAKLITDKYSVKSKFKTGGRKMSENDQNNNQGNQTANKPQGYGTDTCQKSLQDVSKPKGYSTQIITEDDNSTKKR